MKHDKATQSCASAWSAIGRRLAVLCLLAAGAAEATAPRITPQLFADRPADIVAYQLAPIDAAARADGELAEKLVIAAFKAAELTPTLDTLPARQLAKYALLNNEAVALIGSPQDLSEPERKQYRMVTFLLRDTTPGEPAVALIFSKDKREAKWYRAFNEGLQKIIGNGTYLDIIKPYRAKDGLPADYFKRLKRHNPDWK